MSEEKYMWMESDLYDCPFFYKDDKPLDYEEVTQELNNLEAENKRLKELNIDHVSRRLHKESQMDRIVEITQEIHK